MESGIEAWGILQILAEEKAIILDDPEDGLIHLAWESRRFDLFCSLVIEQTQELVEEVVEGMSRTDLLDAMSDLVSGREIVRKLRAEVNDLPGIAGLVMALDQLEEAIAEKGLKWVPA